MHLDKGNVLKLTPGLYLIPAKSYKQKRMYSVFTINVPLAVRFVTVAIGMRKAESPEYEMFDSDLH